MTAATAQVSPDVRRAQRREGWLRRLPLLPALLFTILVTQLPFLFNIYFSLTNWKVVPPQPRTFNGIGNYTALFGNQFFRGPL